jgi:hypothetical protein
MSAVGDGSRLDDELGVVQAQLAALAPASLVERLLALARQDGARSLLQALDAEGRIAPCGQGCGWEGPWSIDTTLWPPERERLLGATYRPPAQEAEAEERLRLLGGRFQP